MHLRGGRYGLIEVKLGGSTRIEEGAATLKALAARIDTDVSLSSNLSGLTDVRKGDKAAELSKSPLFRGWCRSTRRERERPFS